MHISNFQDSRFLRIHAELQEGREDCDSPSREISEDEYRLFFGRESDEEGETEIDEDVKALMSATRVDTAPKPRRVVLARHSLGPVVFGTDHDTIKHTDFALPDNPATLHEEDDDYGVLVESSDPYAEYDHLDTQTSMRGRRGRMIAGLPRSRRVA